MMHAFVMGMLVFAAGAFDKSSACQRDSEGYCVSKRVMVELPAEPDSRTVLVNVALGDAVTLTIASPLAIKQCQRDNETTYCGLVNGNADLLKLGATQGLVTLTPKVPSGARAPADGSMTDELWYEHGNLQLVFETGHQINFEVHIRPPAQAVKQIFVSSAELIEQAEAFETQCDKHMSKRAQKVRDAWVDFDATLERHVRERMGHEVMAGVVCNYDKHTMMSSLLWAQVTSLCQVGKTIYVTATIENRSRTSTFVPDTLRLLSNDGSDAAAISADTTSVAYREVIMGADGPTERKLIAPDVELRYNQDVETSVSIPAAGAPKELALEIKELGGAQRVVRITGIAF